MKSLKRVLALAMVLGVVFALSACGGSKDMSASPYCGTWVATTAEYEGGFTIDLGADGKATLDTDSKTVSCNWEENDTGVALKQSEDILMVDDGNGGLYIEEDGVTIYFEKQ